MGGNPSRAVAQTLQQFQPIKRFSVDALIMSRKDVERVAHIDPIDKTFQASQWYLRGATALDMSTTVIGIEHHGIEAGWARCFGPRNTTAIVAGNVAMNLGVEYVSRRIYQKGGKWKYVATGFNVLKGTMNAADGIHNARYISQH
jgi:hypothetical protein